MKIPDHQVAGGLCVLRLSALGDCINTFGMIGAIRALPDAPAIVWILDSRFAALFRDGNGQDLVSLIPVNSHQSILPALWNLRRQLSSRIFDTLFCLQTSVRASAISLAVKAKVRLGYDKERSREFQRLFVNRTVPSPDNPHVLAGFMAFACSAGYDVAEPKWDFAVSDAEKQPFLDMFNGRRTVLLAPASAKKQKNWTVKGYTEVAKYAQQLGLTVAISGTSAPYDKDLCAAIAQNLQAEACVNLCGKTSLRQMAALISTCCAVIAPDSATMHLASALRVPVVGLFAVHDPRRVGPWNYADLSVSVYESLAKAELHGRPQPWRYRVRMPDAMEKILPETVCAALDRALTVRLQQDTD